MTTRNRVFLGLIGIFILAFGFLTYRLATDIDPRYREPAEDSLIETAHLLASILELDIQGGAIDVSALAPAFRGLYARKFSAQVYSVEKTRVELRVYVTDRAGRVVFDSRGVAVGQDYSRWHDVGKTLAGEYGARTTNDIADDPKTAVMYVGAPLWHADQIVGVVTAGRPVRSFGRYVQAARGRIITAGVASGVAFLLLAILVSVWLVRPVGLVAGYVRYLRREPGASLPILGRGMLRAMAAAYQEMRDALAGRQFVTEYVQTLTHEIKSPLSAIRGAAELLQEPMPESDRARFVGNILRETARTQELVDRLLELASLEQRRELDRVERVSLRAIADEAIEATAPQARQRDIRVAIREPADELSVPGDALLLASALINLLENAIDFSPCGGAVAIGIEQDGERARLSVRDAGPGVPDYAAERVFERFYSLPRPGRPKQGTGLGLVFVKEIAELHGGSASLGNAPGGGAVASLELPIAGPR